MLVLPDAFSPEERGERAANLFRQGYNCCQAVMLAFADVLEANNLVSKGLLATIGSGFGGGMARMREVCGSFSAMVMMAGFISPADNPSVMESRKENYALVQSFAEGFKACNGGSIVCRELLGMADCGTSQSRDPMENPMPSARTEEYYRKRPCAEIIANAARLLAEYLCRQ